MNKIRLKYVTEGGLSIHAVGDLPSGLIGSDEDLSSLQIGAHVAVLGADPVVLFKTNHGCTVAKPDETDAMVEACKRFMDQIAGGSHESINPDTADSRIGEHGTGELA